MDIVSTTPLSANTLVWEPRPGERMLTVCVKVTFSLKNGEVAVLAPQQEALHRDIPWNDTPGSSLYAPSDFVPTKPKVDILLSGRVFAPMGKPVNEIVARVSVDAFSKSLLVRGSRQWVLDNGALVPGPIQPFAYVPIAYAAEELLEHDGGTTKPLVGAALSHFDHVPGGPNVDSPPGFGAISPNLRALRGEGGLKTKRWAESLNARETMTPPAHVDWSFFNSAPRDQQIATLGPTPHLLLENLHPSIPRLETWLPKVLPRVMHLGAGVEQPAEIRLRCDTLRIDTDRGNAILTYRGLLPMGRQEERAFGVLGVMLEGAGAASGMDDLVRQMRERTGSADLKTLTLDDFVEVEPDEEAVGASTAMVAGPSIAAALPFAKAEAGAAIRMEGPKQNTAADDELDDIGGSTLPIVRPVAARALPFGARDAVEANEVGSLTMPVTRSATGPSLPFAKGESALATSLSAEVIARLSAMGSSSDAGRSTLPIGGVPSKKALPFGKDTVVPEEPPPIPVMVEAERAVEPVAAVVVEVAPLAMIGPLATGEMVTREQGALKSEAIKEEPATALAPEELATKKSEPGDFPLESCAALTVTIARRKGDKQKILDDAGLTAEEWGAIEKYWGDAIQGENKRGKRTLLDRFDNAYLGQLEKERGSIGVEEYAKLTLAAETGTVNDVAAELSIPRGAVMRIERVWVQRITRDAGLGARVNRAIAQGR